MRKKILPFILVFIILISCSIFIFYTFNTKNNNVVDYVIDEKNIVDDSEPIQDSTINSSNEDIISKTQDEEKQVTNDVSKNDVVNNEKNTTSSNQETTNQTADKKEKTKEEVSSNNNNNNDDNVPSTDNKQDDDKIIVDETTDNSNDSNVPVEEQEETSTPQVDQELERLKSLIKYKTSQECFDASIDVSFEYENNENFKHTACESFAYKGQLLGYRMLIYYNDGTTEYLDAIG